MLTLVRNNERLFVVLQGKAPSRNDDLITKNSYDSRANVGGYPHRYARHRSSFSAFDKLSGSKRKSDYRHASDRAQAYPKPDKDLIEPL
jgi:hypothetical protein